MRKWISIICISLLLAGGVVLCAIRWQAWFGMPDEPQWRGDTLHYIFPSCSDAVFESDSLTILILGDVHNGLTRADYDTLAARVPQTDVVAQCGDWLERGQFYYYQLLIREWTNSRLDSLPVIACPGNHEYSKGLDKQLSPVWEEAFPHPANGPAEVPGASYFVDLPQLRFIVIDTNPLGRLVNLTRTLTWLRQTMQSAGNRYIVVMMHHPVYSAGKGRFNALIYSAFRRALRETDLVIAGHDHSYMRTANFVVLNAAGTPKPQHSRFTPDASDTVTVYGVLDLAPAYQPSLTFKVHRLADGTLVDSLYVNHD